METRQNFFPMNLFSVYALIFIAFAAPVAGTAWANSFVVDPPSPSWPDSNDILVDRPGPIAALPRLGISSVNLGLQAQDVIDAISDGRDPVDATLHPGIQKLIFSVRRSSVGVAGTAVNQERIADTAPPGGMNGHASDLFVWDGTIGQNFLAAMPLGWSLGSGSGDEANANLRLPAGANPGDNVTGFDRRFLRVPPPADDGVGAGVPPFPVFFSLQAGSPTLAMIGADPGDVLVVGGPFGAIPVVFIDSATLALPAGAELDGLNLEVIADAAGTLVLHQVRFSVDAGSVGFALPDGSIVDSGATVLLYDGATTTIAITPADQGLLLADDIDALESAVTALGLNAGGIIFDPIGGALVQPLPGGQGVHVDNAAANGEGGVEFGFPPALAVTFDADFEKWASSVNRIRIEAGVEGFTSMTRPHNDGLRLSVPILDLSRRETGTVLRAQGFRPTAGTDDDVYFLKAEILLGSAVVHAMVIMPDPGFLDISVEDVPEGIDVSVAYALQNDPDGRGLGLVTEIGFPALDLKIGGETFQSDGLRIYAYANLPEDRYTLTGVKAVASSQGGDTIGNFQIREFMTRRGAVIDLWEHAALGEARVAPGSEDGIQVSNLGPSGEDGISVALNKEAAADESFGSIATKFDDAARATVQRTSWNLVSGSGRKMLIEIARERNGDPFLLTAGADHPPADDVVFNMSASGPLGAGGDVRLAAGRLGVFESDLAPVEVRGSDDGIEFVYVEEVSFNPTGGFPPLRGTRFTLSDFGRTIRRVVDDSRLRRVEIRALGVLSFTVIVSRAAAAPVFRRGDTDRNGEVDISDAISTISYLFLGGADLACRDAADSNDDGEIDLSDVLHTLNFLFLGGALVPAPGPTVCGRDPTPDRLDCADYGACP